MKIPGLDQKPDTVCRALQKIVMGKVPPNSFEPRAAAQDVVRTDGVRFVSEIRYGEQYPNSFLDIWYAPVEQSASCPTLIYIHGGGFIFGDKRMGDPLAQSSGADVVFFAELAKRGYNVVSPNYALAPEYRFPVQVAQVDQMLAFLMAHREKYGLDMERVFLGGGSAGADLTEIYGAVLTNPAYAAKLGIAPSIPRSQIKGLIIDEAALSPRNFEEKMNAMLGCWLGEETVNGSKTAQLMDATNWIGSSYIPSFIIASNKDIFFKDSAEDLAAVLEKNGTAYEYFYRGPEFGVLDHGFMQTFATNPCAKECFTHMLAFLKSNQSAQ